MNLDKEKRAHERTKEHVTKSNDGRKKLQEQVSILNTDVGGLDLDLKKAKEEIKTIQEAKEQEYLIQEERV